MTRCVSALPRLRQSRAAMLDLNRRDTSLGNTDESKGNGQMMWRIAAVGMALALAACSTSGLSGAGAGSAVQAYSPAPNAAQQPVSTSIVEAMAGGLIGGTLGARLDQRERRRGLEAEYRALEYTPAGQSVAWSGSRTSGEVVAGSPYRVGTQNCRQYTHSVNSDGQVQTARGAACRNADGSWTPLA